MLQKWIALFLVFYLSVLLAHAQDPGKILIVQDEMLQLEVLIPYLRETGELEVQTVDQENLPGNLGDYQAVVGFIHGRLYPETERAIIRYTDNGGRFICLHHTISSGKAQNEHFFEFLGIRLDHPEFSRYPVQPGEGYGWYHDGNNYITLHLVSLNPNHYITNHNVEWTKKMDYTPSDFPSAPGTFPAITLPATEVYLNHKFTDGRQKQVLAGFKFYDERTHQIFMQDRAIWWKQYGNGEVVYIMPGESQSDYKNKNIAQIILNAINWKQE